MRKLVWKRDVNPCGTAGDSDLTIAFIVGSKLLLHPNAKLVEQTCIQMRV